MFTISDRLVAHLQKSKKPQCHHDWFLINCGKLVNWKGPGFRTWSYISCKVERLNCFNVKKTLQCWAGNNCIYARKNDCKCATMISKWVIIYSSVVQIISVIQFFRINIKVLVNFKYQYIQSKYDEGNK